MFPTSNSNCEFLHLPRKNLFSFMACGNFNKREKLLLEYIWTIRILNWFFFAVRNGLRRLKNSLQAKRSSNFKIAKVKNIWSRVFFIVSINLLTHFLPRFYLMVISTLAFFVYKMFWDILRTNLECSGCFGMSNFQSEQFTF